MTMVKICGMTDAAAVQAAVDAGADAIGFVFAKSVRQVDAHDARQMAACIPAGIRKVAVMLHPENEAWQEVFEVFEPDVLQTDAEDFLTLKVEESIERWPVLREGAVPGGDLPPVFLYEGKTSGQGQTVNWGAAADIAQRGKLILAGGLNAANVATAIHAVNPWGVDVSSAVESAPGRKDANKIRAFIKAARVSED